jgi:hypothetical protein
MLQLHHIGIVDSLDVKPSGSDSGEERARAGFHLGANMLADVHLAVDVRQEMKEISGSQGDECRRIWEERHRASLRRLRIGLQPMSSQVLVELGRSKRASFSHLRLGHNALAIEVKEDTSSSLQIVNVALKSRNDERINCPLQLFAQEVDPRLLVLASGSQNVNGLV